MIGGGRGAGGRAKVRGMGGGVLRDGGGGGESGWVQDLFCR